jgi:uncharacterized protein
MSEGRIHDGFVPGRFEIEAYGNGGFRFADMSHRGSILVLPSGILAWPVAEIGEVTPASLQPILEEAGEIDLLLVGTGMEMKAFPQVLRQIFREANIRLDVMQTGAAARTYNILLGERRKVGAALIAVP